MQQQLLCCFCMTVRHLINNNLMTEDGLATGLAGLASQLVRGPGRCLCRVPLLKGP